jgi:hypothetical protein
MNDTNNEIIDSLCQKLALAQQQRAILLASLELLLAFAIEANNRLPSPATPEDFAAGFGCNQFTVDAFKSARAAIAKAKGESDASN